MEIIKRIVHYLSIITYVLISIYVVVCIPLLFKYKPLVVLSGSMEPTFKTGSVIYYREVSLNELKVGDIITFNTKSNSFVSHRIVSIEGNLIETKGDANNSPDVNKVQFDDVLGKDLNISIPYVGYYIWFVNNNLISVVVFVVLILVSEFLFGNMKTLDIDREDRRDNNGEKG